MVEATVCRNEPRSQASLASSRRPVFFTDSTQHVVVERRDEAQVDDLGLEMPYFSFRTSAASSAR